MQRSIWQRIVLFVGASVLIAFVFSGLFYFGAQSRSDRPIRWREVLQWQAIIYGWAALFPLIVLFSRRFRFERQNRVLSAVAHLFGAFLFLLAHAVIYAFLHVLINGFQLRGDQTFIGFSWRIFALNTGFDLPTYLFILSLGLGHDYYRRFQKEQLRTSQLEVELANSQLQALKMQLHPHFLFNTLNSISALMHEDVRTADRMVASLGDFLRLTLANSGKQTITLGEEMDFLNRYLEIESVRFQDRLSVETEIEPETLKARVPNLILQPIIENAIKHGIARWSAAGHIAIRARRLNDMLQIQIEDNGPGLSADGESENSPTNGIGLANTRSRLSYLYGENQRFEISNAEPHGFVVTLEIPFEQQNGND